MLKQHLTKKFQNIQWQSGHTYKFRYTNWQNDPEPVMIMLCAYSGTHETTGHEWRFFQGINFTYIPWTRRRQFAKRWLLEWQATGGKLQLTWSRIIMEFPYLSNAIRRYFYKPNYYIQSPVEIPFEDIDDVIVTTWDKDFSKKVQTNLIQKYRAVQGRRPQRI